MLQSDIDDIEKKLLVFLLDQRFLIEIFNKIITLLSVTFLFVAYIIDEVEQTNKKNEKEKQKESQRGGNLAIDP